MAPESTRRWFGAEWAGLTVLLLVAIATRTVNLDRYSGSYPEGVRAEQLLLMSLGYRPFRDIFSDQGPWLLDALYPGFALFGPSLVGVRAVVVLASLIGLLGAWWLARSLGGRIAGLATLLLLIASPTYLKFSRLAVAELAALAPATLAVAASARYAAVGGKAWVVLAGVLLALSLLIKPIALAAGLAVGVAVISRAGRRLALLVLAGVTLLTALTGMLLVGLPEIVNQIVLFRLESREVEGWKLADNLARAQEELGDEGLAFYLLGGLGLVLALARRQTWPLAVWMVGSLATVAAHSPLHAKHFTIVVIPTALLAGLALGLPWNRLVERTSPSLRLGLAALVVSLAGLYALSLPELTARVGAAMTRTDLFDRDASIHWYDDAIQTLAATTPPGSFVVSDHAYLAFAAGQSLPPYLAEASATRVRAGSLTDQEAITHTRAFDSQAVLWWADKLVGLKQYRSWLQEEYSLARVWATENDTRPELWLPRDGPGAEYRRAMRAGLTEGPPDALDGRLRAVAWGPRQQETQAGDVARLIVEWEAVAPVPADTLVEVGIRDPAGGAIDDEREPLLGGRELLEPGWRMSWVGGVRLPARPEPGEYQLYLRLRDRVNRRSTEELPVGIVQVSRPES